MATAENVQKLESRALKAEQIIEWLKVEVAELFRIVEANKAGGLNNCAAQYEQVKKENEKLKKEIEAWKQKLIDAEKKLNIAQVDPIRTKCSPGREIEAVESKKSELPVKAEADAKSKKKAPVAPAAPSEEPAVDVGRLDIRIGKIVSVKKHPDADSLYVEQVELGEEKPRTIVSGLVKFVPIEEMENRLVVVLCNLKPAKMRGVSSEGMVLCASTPEKVEILIPPSDAAPGDRVLVDGYSHNPDPVLNPKKKIFETVAPDLKTNSERVATYKGVPLAVPGKGPVSTSTLTNVNIK